tara:strand:+ start:304 stop:663 length:360 start_codon:yes stop_codon:yes gene_type:complete
MRFILIPLLFIFSLAWTQTINEGEFEEKINEDIVVIEFYADWNKDNCVELSQFKDVSTYMVNIEDSPNLTQTYKVYSIPTIIIFYNQEMVEKYEADLTFQLCIKSAKKKVEELVLNKFR